MSTTSKIKNPEEYVSTVTSLLSSLDIKEEKKDYKIDYLKQLIFTEKRNVFLSSPAGTGKSYLLQALKQIADDKNIETYICSTTGVSAILIGGNTIHSLLGVGICSYSKKACEYMILRNERACNVWKNARILFIDEISMLGKKTFEYISDMGKILRENGRPFGGIQLVIAGDLLQLPPVKDDFLFYSGDYKDCDFEMVELTTPHRYIKCVDYFHFLSRLRVGKQTEEDIKNLQKRVNIKTDWKSTEIQPTFLFPRKERVEEYNDKKLCELPGPSISYEVHKQIMKKKFADVSDSEVEKASIQLSNVIPDIINIRIGAQVMLMYNKSVDLDLVNGSRGIVMSTTSTSVNVMFRNGLSVDIGYHAFKYTSNQFTLTHLQIPLILAWASSIHKCQGATIDSVVVDIGKNIFSGGMAYVALSRVRSFESLYISDFEEKKLYPNKEALDFLYDPVALLIKKRILKSFFS